MVVSGDAEVIGKAVLAGALGFVVGWEREAHGHWAGTRTLALVSLAAAVLTALAIQTFPEGPGRVVQGIIQGVGFVGAGIILRGRTGGIRGLTTAAAVWTVASVGVLSGTGHYVAAVGLTVVILLLLWWPYIPLLKRLQPRLTRDVQRYVEQEGSGGEPLEGRP